MPKWRRCSECHHTGQIMKTCPECGAQFCTKCGFGNTCPICHKGWLKYSSEEDEQESW